MRGDDVVREVHAVVRRRRQRADETGAQDPANARPRSRHEISPPALSNDPIDDAAQQTLWYFAYGSNLDPGTFLGRRRMRPLESRVGLLAEFELRFDLPVGPGERAVANVAPRAGDSVWGVAYRLSHSDAERLDRTEGVPRGAYLRLSVEVRDTAGAAIAAFTYHSSRGVEGRKPSRRYLGLILAGARHHGLPAEYVARLRELPLAVDERETQLPLF
jgi:cation transport regulator ChaC